MSYSIVLRIDNIVRHCSLYLHATFRMDCSSKLAPVNLKGRVTIHILNPNTFSLGPFNSHVHYFNIKLQNRPIYSSHFYIFEKLFSPQIHLIYNKIVQYKLSTNLLRVKYKPVFTSIWNLLICTYRNLIVVMVKKVKRLVNIYFILKYRYTWYDCEI